MRSSYQVSLGPVLTPAVKWIIIGCCGVFILQQLFGQLIVGLFGLTPYLVLHQFFLWQPFTYLFLHAGLGHILFNMIGLWMFGSDLERYWGSSKFIRFFLFTGAGAGVLSVLAHPFLRRIDGIVFGENPREGFMEDGWFLHPELRFRIRFPHDWKVQNTRSMVAAVDPGGAAAIQLSLAQEQTSPEDYANKLSQQPGIRLLEGRRTSINGNPSFLGAWELQDPQGGGQSLGVVAAFISYRGNLYQVAGLTAAQNLQAASRTFESSLMSFDELNDSRALNVQPDRLRVTRARGGETLSTIASRTGNRRAELEQLALINRLEPNEPLREGVPVKIVDAGRR